jgi:histidine triad (HIT) family protein
MPCLFCDFVSGKRKKNLNGLPFIPLHVTKHTLTFLSIDFPAHEIEHMLVIPRKHFSFIEDVPDAILAALAKEVKLCCAIIRKNHAGCNVLLNNGRVAGQYQVHVHFHVIPRDKKDNIKIEQWKKKNMTEEQFIKLSAKVRRQFPIS